MSLASSRTSAIPETELRYHVPGSQVWPGSAGRQKGNVHIHVKGELDAGRLKRSAGHSLCGHDGWYERPPESSVEQLCPACVDKAERYGVPYPGLPIFD